MSIETEKLKKRLINKSKRNNVPYYHELMKFKIQIEKGFEQLKKKYKKLEQEDESYEILLEEYRKINNSNKL
ncbi:MAG: hypothetical protein WCX73_01480 [Candidatus Pacearchaeota archaeon]|jgi:hypothetical protein